MREPGAPDPQGKPYGCKVLSPSLVKRTIKWNTNNHFTEVGITELDPKCFVLL